MYKRHFIAIVLTSNLFRRYDILENAFLICLDRDAQHVRWASSSCHYHAPLDATRAAPVQDVFGQLLPGGGVEWGWIWQVRNHWGWTNHGFLLHSLRHWNTGNCWLNPPWTTFRWCGKHRWFSKRHTYLAKRTLVGFPLMGRLFVEYFRWKKVKNAN